MVESGSPKPVMKVRFLPLLHKEKVPPRGGFFLYRDMEESERRSRDDGESGSTNLSADKYR